MRLLSRLLVIVGCLALVLLLAGAGGIAFLTGTEAGNRFMQDRTQATIARLLGPVYSSDLGTQSFEIRPDGTLAIGWRDVTLSRVDRPDSPTHVERIAFAIRLLPLAGGGLEFGRLEIEGAEIDLRTFLADQAPRPARGPAFAEIAEGAVTSLERQLAGLAALNFDTLAFENISIRGLPIEGTRTAAVELAELVRGGEGQLNLSAELTVGALPLSLTGGAGFDAAGRLDELSLRSGSVSLSNIAPPAAAADMFDERRFGTDADFSVALRVFRDDGSGRLVADLTANGGPGEVQAGRNRTRLEEAQLRLRYREGEERIEVRPSPVRFSEVAFDLEGSFEPSLDRDDRILFELSAPAVRSSVGRTEAIDPLTASLVLAGWIEPFDGRASADRIEVATGDGRLSGQGLLDLSSAAAKTSLVLDGTAIGSPEIKAFWPFNLSGKARRWAIDHLGDEGTASEIAFRIDVERQRLADAFGPLGLARPDEISGDIRFANIATATFGDLPRLYNANGHLRIRGGRSQVIAEDAMVVDHPAVALGNSTLSFAKAVEGNRRDTLLSMRIKAAGAMPELLAIADAEPVRGLRDLEFGPADTSGTAQASAIVNLRLGDDIAPRDALRDFAVTADLLDVSIAKPIEGRSFTNLSGKVSISPDAASVELSGLMDAIPATIAAAVPVGSTSTVERTATIDLTVAEEVAIRIVPALRNVLDGPVAARVVQDGQGLHARLDLGGARLAIPAVAWVKGSGIPAVIETDIVRDGEVTQLADLRLSGTGFSAAGSAVIDAGGLRSARLNQAALNAGDSISLTLERSPNGFSMAIEGEQFDARPLLQELRENAGRPRERDESGLTFDISASIERVRGFDERILGGLTVDYASYDGRVAALSLSASSGAGEITADYSPRGEGRAIRVATSDLGSLIGFAGLYGNMEGGAANLELSGTADGAYQGALDIRNFALVDEPRLERFVGTEPVPGGGSLSQLVGRDLRTSRAFFDQASAALYYGDGRLAVGGGILRGPVFGSSFDGTLYDRDSRIDIAGSFMPAYTVNRIFGSIPLVGQLLGNGNEGGLLGITYALTGDFASPTLTINPISIIAPGIFRQIFEY